MYVPTYGPRGPPPPNNAHGLLSIRTIFGEDLEPMTIHPYVVDDITMVVTTSKNTVTPPPGVYEVSMAGDVFNRTGSTINALDITLDIRLNGMFTNGRMLYRVFNFHPGSKVPSDSCLAYLVCNGTDSISFHVSNVSGFDDNGDLDNTVSFDGKYRLKRIA